MESMTMTTNLKIADSLTLPLDIDLAPRGPTVVRLLLGCSPATVLWRVGTVIVDAVDRVCGRWPRPHVAQERLEVRSPSVADGDPAPAPVGVVGCQRVETTVLDSLPGVVFRRSAQPVSAIGSRRPLALETSTRGNPLTKVILAHTGGAAAVAVAQPETMPWCPFRFARNYQSTKPLANKIGKSRPHVGMVPPAHSTCGDKS